MRATNTTLNVPKARWIQTCQQYHAKETRCPKEQVKHTLSTAPSQYVHRQQHQKQNKCMSYAGTHPEEPRSHDRAAASVRCTWRWKRGGPGETNWGLGWGIRRRRTWHGTYARRLEALPDGMHSQGGWEGRIRAMSLKGTTGKWGEGGRATKQQRTAREIAEASGERRRRPRRRCTGRGWLQERVERQPPTLRAHREIAHCRSSDNHVKFLNTTLVVLFDEASMH